MARRRQSKKKQPESDDEPIEERPVQDCIHVDTRSPSPSPSTPSNIASSTNTSTTSSARSTNKPSSSKAYFMCPIRRALDKSWGPEDWHPSKNLPKGSVPAGGVTRSDVSNLFDITTLAVQHSIPLPSLYEKGGAIYDAAALGSSRVLKWTAYTSEWALNRLKDQTASMPPKNASAKVASPAKAPGAKIGQGHAVTPALPPIPLTQPAERSGTASVPTKPSGRRSSLPSTPREPSTPSSQNKASAASSDSTPGHSFDARKFALSLKPGLQVSIPSKKVGSSQATKGAVSTTKDNLIRGCDSPSSLRLAKTKDPLQLAKGFAKRSPRGMITKTYATQHQPQSASPVTGQVPTASTTLAKLDTAKTLPEATAKEKAQKDGQNRIETPGVKPPQIIRDSVSPDSGISMSTPSSANGDASQAARAGQGGDEGMPTLENNKRPRAESTTMNGDAASMPPPQKKRKYVDVEHDAGRARQDLWNLSMSFKRQLEAIQEKYMSDIPAALDDRVKECEDFLAEDERELENAVKGSEVLDEEFAMKAGEYDEAQKNEGEYTTFVTQFEKHSDALPRELQASNQLALESMKNALKCLEANTAKAKLELTKARDVAQDAKKRVEELNGRVKASKWRVNNLDAWDVLQNVQATAEEFVDQVFEDFNRGETDQ